MQPTLTFHGAAGCVTGSCAEIRCDAGRVLIDCGMFQGSKTLKALNYGRFPFDPSEIDAVLLTHAHIDHSGLLPKLMRAGFHGKIYATASTRDLCEVMLADAAGIQESEVRRLNHRNERRGRRAVEPIYTRHDAARVMDLFKRVKLGDTVVVLPGLEAVYWEAGHILGSASVEVRIAGEGEPMRLLFSGDLGQGGSEFLPDPSAPIGIDHLIMESTYGDRPRPPIDGASRRRALAEELRQAHAAGGPLIIPAFAVERTQELLSDLIEITAGGDAPEADIFLDSPLAIEATEIFRSHGWNHSLGRNPFESVHPSARLRFTRDPAESDKLERLKGWHIIMAASGMCDAGRIRNHLRRHLWRPQATILLTGFQAVGTLGRLLADGEKTIRIQGDEIKVQARLRSLDVYSGHADANALEAWALARRPVDGCVFLVHGEPRAALGLKARLTQAGFAEDRLIIPELDQRFVLQKRQVDTVATSRRIEAEAAASPDWHNRRAHLLGELDTALQAASDDAHREDLLLHLEACINGRGPAVAAKPAA